MFQIQTRSITCLIKPNKSSDQKFIFSLIVQVSWTQSIHLYPRLHLEDFEKTFRTNTRGAFVCCKEAANRVVRGGGGRIIMMSTSQVGALSPGYGVYTASKAAVETMVRVLAKELKGSQITANCVAPGPVATEMFYAGKSDETVKMLASACPMGRIGEPKDVAEIVGFLAGDGGEWINGQVIRTNGGFVV